MCKGEQMSNWENRPLRLCQQHYGALDAYCLILIIQELTKAAKQKNKLNLMNPSTIDIKQGKNPFEENKSNGGNYKKRQQEKRNAKNQQRKEYQT